MNEYATLSIDQHTYGVQVPVDNGSCTTHYTEESEALEVIDSLNKAYDAGFKVGWDNCYRLFKVPTSTKRE